MPVHEPQVMDQVEGPCFRESRTKLEQSHSSPAPAPGPRTVNYSNSHLKGKGYSPPKLRQCFPCPPQMPARATGGPRQSDSFPLCRPTLALHSREVWRAADSRHSSGECASISAVCSKSSSLQKGGWEPAGLGVDGLAPHRPGLLPLSCICCPLPARLGLQARFLAC